MTLTGSVTFERVGVDLRGLGAAPPQNQPARGIVVTIQDARGEVLARTVTSQSGDFTTTFTTSSSTVSVVAYAKTLDPPIQVEDNTDGDSVYGVMRDVPAVSGGASLSIPSGWTGTSFTANRRLAAPFAILDTMSSAARAFTSVRPVVFPMLKVNWSPKNVPQSGDKARGFIGTSHFAPSDNQLYILGKDGVDTDEFDTHVIAHEWGHFYQSNISRSDSPGGRHGPGDVLDPRVAFGEGWGNALAAMVLPTTSYVDTSWSSSGLRSFGFDLESAPTPTDDPNPSAFSEASVMRTLYDFYDSNADGAFDRTALGLGPIHDAMVADKTTAGLITLASFVEKLKRGTSQAVAIDAVLAHSSIGPITNQWGDGDAQLRNMFTYAVSLPWSGSVALGAGHPSNSWQQNQYYLFEGTGGAVTVSATAPKDVVLVASSGGQRLGWADNTQSGTETLSVMTQAGRWYVVVLTGFGEGTGDYDVSVSIR
ncbi:MAG: hypothetical protein JNJ54_09915 [Myxococcaceae bacterium]|nr:hypothetical protein [Myxococcaceae bacterium]